MLVVVVDKKMDTWWWMIHLRVWTIHWHTRFVHEFYIHTLQTPQHLSLFHFIKLGSLNSFLILCFFFTSNIFSLSQSKTQSKVTMKLMNNQSLKRNQFMKWGKQIGSSTTASATLVNSEDRTTVVAFAFSCCGKPPRVLLKQFVWRLKSRLRLSRKSDHNNNIQYSYDLRSYHLNFDDGWSSRWWFQTNKIY